MPWSISCPQSTLGSPRPRRVRPSAWLTHLRLKFAMRSALQRSPRSAEKCPAAPIPVGHAVHVHDSGMQVDTAIEYVPPLRALGHRDDHLGRHLPKPEALMVILALQRTAA